MTTTAKRSNVRYGILLFLFWLPYLIMPIARRYPSLPR